MEFTGSLMKYIAEPARNFSLSHIIGNDDVIKPGKFSFSHIGTENLPAIWCFFNTEKPAKDVINQHK